ncbi:iron ABC transporter ATP-binding protein [Gryllotalpicola koreensis]|uniref:Uncharacterized protein n=1 Tax=Gryllotalpicola koreensis TaxID=993086 RepID=A0ABP8AA27_9MICO
MPSARPALRLTTALAAAAVTATLLAGCAPASSTTKDTSKPGSSSSAAPTDTDTSAASPTPTPTPTPTPVTLQQGQIWTAQQVYDFNPNFSPDPNYKLADGSAAAKLVQLSGVSFGWVNQTSGDTIEVAVAHPSAENVDQFSGAVASSGAQQVPIDGAPAGTVSYFTVADGVGTLQIFTDNGYWVVVDSKTFLEPGDSYQIASDVMGNLK